METRQFAEAAKVFLKLEEKAVKDGKFQSHRKYRKSLDVLAIAFGKLLNIGEERLFQMQINGHRPIGQTAFRIAEKFMNAYAINRTLKTKNYEEGIYTALACVCEATKELEDYGY